MGGFGMGGSSELMLLSREDVRQELDLLDEQTDELAGLRDGLDMRGMMEEMRDAEPEDRPRLMQQAMEKARKKIQDQVSEVLMPHQAKRLQQLSVQFAMQSPFGITGGTVAEKLGISEEQQEQLRDKARQLQEELQKKLREELIQELTPEQQEKLKSLTGKPFTFEQTPSQFGGGRRGGGTFGRRGAEGGRRPDDANAPRRRRRAD